MLIIQESCPSLCSGGCFERGRNSLPVLLCRGPQLICVQDALSLRTDVCGENLLVVCMFRSPCSCWNNILLSNDAVDYSFTLPDSKVVREASLLQTSASEASPLLIPCSRLLLTFSKVYGYNTRNRNILDPVFTTGLTHVRIPTEGRFFGCDLLPASCTIILTFRVARHRQSLSTTLEQTGVACQL